MYSWYAVRGNTYWLLSKTNKAELTETLLRYLLEVKKRKQILEERVNKEMAPARTTTCRYDFRLDLKAMSSKAPYLVNKHRPNFPKIHIILWYTRVIRHDTLSDELRGRISRQRGDIVKQARERCMYPFQTKYRRYCQSQHFRWVCPPSRFGSNHHRNSSEGGVLSWLQHTTPVDWLLLWLIR